MHFDRKKMLAWWNSGYNTVFDENRIEIFNPIKTRNNYN